MSKANTAVLVIDDEEMVRDNIEEILVPHDQDEELDYINDALNVLFDTPKPILTTRAHNIPAFTVEKAANGMEGVRKVIEALEKGTPYAVIFLDMRMPGWNGLETAQEIRKYDNKAEIIFITAYSDKSIDEIVEQAGQHVGYHCKPYAPEEILQLATKAVNDYNRLRNLEQLIESISYITFDKNHLDSLLKNILDQIASSLETDMALMGKLHDDLTYEKVLSTGALEGNIHHEELISRIRNIQIEKNEVIQVGDLVLARMENYSVFAVLKQQETLKTEKMYLLKLFVQNAGQAIRNAELNQKLLQKEKLSAIGQVISMVMHDLRTPIKNIKLITNIMREEGENSELVDMIDKSAEQASEIFDDFLDFVNDTPVRKLPVSLTRIATEAIELADSRESIGNIKVSLDIPANITIAGDESKLRRTIYNLIANAADALTQNRMANGAVTVAAREEDLFVKLTVRDNGPGIPAEIMNTLFDAFVTRNKSNGTGLGLAIVKQYVNAHGGEINVHNDQGAVFTLTFPL